MEESLVFLMCLLTLYGCWSSS